MAWLGVLAGGLMVLMPGAIYRNYMGFLATLAAFALGLMLLLVTLLLNVIALYVVRKYREQYE
jgi:ABC-type phosphate transport system permease subunit